MGPMARHKRLEDTITAEVTASITNTFWSTTKNRDTSVILYIFINTFQQ